MMKSLLLVAVALVLVFSVPQVYHELHPVTIQPNQGAYFQIINKEIPKGGVLNGNVTIYVDGELNDDVVVCLNKFYGLPPLGNYNTQTCDVFLVFVGTPKPSTTHETTSTTQISSESSVESTSGATSDHSTSESTGATSDLSTSESTTPSTESTTQHETTSTSDAESTSTTEVVTSTTEQPTSTSHAESTSTTEVVTSTTEQPTTTHDTTSTTQVSTSTTKVATSTSTTKVATSTSTTEQPTTTHDTTSTTQVSTSTTKVATSTTKVATSTSTTEVATSTSTTEVATSTSTTEQPITTHDTTSTTQVATSTTEVSSTTTPQQHFRRYVTLSQMAYEFLKTDLYNVGVYFLNTPAKGAKLTFSLGFNGTYCAAKTTGPNCENTIADLGDATTFVLGTQPAYYTFTVNSNTDAKQAVSNLTLNFASASFVNIYASSYAVPTADNRDFYGNSTLSIPVPTPGTWYVTVAAGVDGDNVTYSNKTQTASVASTLLNGKEEKYESGKIKAGTPKYYSINLNTSDSFSVTIKTEAAVTLYAGFNRVPQLVNGNWAGYDITGCNLFNCSAYKNIKSLRLSPNPVNGTWFVAVVSGTTEEKDYTIWYQFDCPFNCSGNGVCQTDKSNFGFCKCNGNFDGLTCGEDNMIIEYIILIIIAALVLVSALLGLIAWAYMRRRSQYVEVK